MFRFHSFSISYSILSIATLTWMKHENLTFGLTHNLNNWDAEIIEHLLFWAKEPLIHFNRLAFESVNPTEQCHRQHFRLNCPRRARNTIVKFGKQRSRPVKSWMFWLKFLMISSAQIVGWTWTKAIGSGSIVFGKCHRIGHRNIEEYRAAGHRRLYDCRWWCGHRRGRWLQVSCEASNSCPKDSCHIIHEILLF